jgi:glucokinase
MFLAIEIGGTKLQLAVGEAPGSPLVELQRFDVQPAEGAVGILRTIERNAPVLCQRHGVKAIGVGFGGPVDLASQRVICSHQIEGWDDFRLGQWFQRVLALPVSIANDADTAALAEATCGAGRGANPVFYVTVGSGVGGGLVNRGQIYHGFGQAAAEIGHLRPGLNADQADHTVESLASGWGIALAAQERLSEPVAHRLGPWFGEPRPSDPEVLRQKLIEAEEAAEEHAADLLERCDGVVDQLTAKMVAQAAAEGNEIALSVLHRATSALGWAIAQVITLLSPEVVVVGGGVSLAGDTLFFGPLRQAVARYVFPPLADSYRIVPAALGEEVVLHGALALAATAEGC